MSITTSPSSLFLEKLQTHHNPLRALADKRYHKSTREHWGVCAPLCNALIGSFIKNYSAQELLNLAQELWKTNIFDPMICAAKILGRSRIPPSDQLWATVVCFLQDIDGWGLEDSLAHAAWKCLLADRSLLATVDTWTQHPNFWIRRAALVYTLPFAKQGHDPKLMLQWASLYASDPEWFIQKAIGWWLRVLGQHNPEQVRGFLNKHWGQLKGVARKEATRKLKPLMITTDLAQ